MLRFEDVNKTLNDDTIKFLFDLLKSKKFSISHINLPSFEEHRNFVINNPYRSWNIIFEGQNKIGAFYLGYDNSVGIHLSCKFELYFSRVVTLVESNFDALPPSPSLRCSYLFFNVNPNDFLKVNALRDLGYEISQISFQKICI